MARSKAINIALIVALVVGLTFSFKILFNRVSSLDSRISGLKILGSGGARTGGGITSLGGLTGAIQTFTNDTNVTVTSSGSTHTLGWASTLSIARGGWGNDGTATTTRTSGGLSVQGGGLESTAGIVISGGSIISTGKLAVSALATSTFTGGFEVGTGSTGGLLTANGLTLTGGSILGTGMGSSTLSAGLNITTGCFAIAGVCVGAGGGSGTVGTGVTGQLPYYAANGTVLTATSTLFIATDGRLGIGTTTPLARLVVDGGSAYCAEKSFGSITADLLIDWNTACQVRLILGADNLQIDFATSSYHLGQIMRVIACQDGTGSRTIRRWHGNIMWTGGGTSTQSTVNGRCDAFSFVVSGGTGTDRILGSAVKNF